MLSVKPDALPLGHDGQKPESQKWPWRLLGWEASREKKPPDQSAAEEYQDAGVDANCESPRILRWKP